ncbi:restriction endonuclease subunit S [Roseimarinus sediminis]|uniref:restriction endonuclease subunit S n=1 Tax=Roseimarinus sediminis TaxID=1610899 RepID=UPI003D19C245
MSWEEKPLGEIVNLKRGYDLPSRLRTKGTVPIVSSSGVTDYHNKSKYIGEGVITGRYGTLGQVFYVNGEYWPLNTTLYVQDFKGNYPRYIYYYLKLLELEQYNGAAAVPGLDRNVLHKIKCILPTLPTQKKIASILSAYDDLIENNLKRIKLLEEAAQNIYKEWFVHFRFPGWENAKFDKGTGLPEGWKQSTIFDEVEINSGGTPKTTNPSFWNGDIPFFTPTDASKNSHFYVNQTEKTINEDGLKKCNSKLYPFNTVFITARGTVGNLCLAMIPMAMNQSCYALIGKNSLSQLFIFFSVNDSISKIKKTASGGVFDTIIVDTFKRIPFIIPEYTLILKFENQVTAILNQTQNLIIQNQKLKEARDILLPRLMNQTINV